MCHPLSEHRLTATAGDRRSIAQAYAQAYDLMRCEANSKIWRPQSGFFNVQSTFQNQSTYSAHISLGMPNSLRMTYLSFHSYYLPLFPSCIQFTPLYPISMSFYADSEWLKYHTPTPDPSSSSTSSGSSQLRHVTPIRPSRFMCMPFPPQSVRIIPAE